MRLFGDFFETFWRLFGDFWCHPKSHRDFCETFWRLFGDFWCHPNSHRDFFETFLKLFSDFWKLFGDFLVSPEISPRLLVSPDPREVGRKHNRGSTYYNDRGKPHSISECFGFMSVFFHCANKKTKNSKKLRDFLETFWRLFVYTSKNAPRDFLYTFVRFPLKPELVGIQEHGSICQ